MTLALPASRWLHIDGVDLLSECGRILRLELPDAEAMVEDLTGPSCSAIRQEFNGTVMYGDLQIEGLLGTDTTTYFKAQRSKLVAADPTDLAVIVGGFEGVAVGKQAMGCAAIPSRIGTPMQAKMLTRFALQYKPVGKVNWGPLMSDPTSAITAGGTTEGASQDNLVATTAGARLMVSVPTLSLGGYTNFSVQFRKSTDNATWSNLGTALVFTVPGAKYLDVTGTIPRYLAYTVSFTGTGSGPSTTMAAFVGRN